MKQLEKPPATATTAIVAKATQIDTETQSALFYPPPISTYYFGPPDTTRAFGEEVTAKPGIHLPKEIVRIERDYSSGELPQFHSSFPLELEGRISPTTFSELINDLNSILIDAHNPTRTWIDNSIAIATFYLSTVVFGSHYRRTMQKLETFIQRSNIEILHPVGLSLADPRKSAFLFVEMEYY
ncbi:uncharacterized protein UTRI_04452 [Ustilago trichophora]|uniref:Ras modification protein ERF4 n=1 Tax=Ustilago trichophora TaxID=86804 RepID=A0A5C3ED12_9BASI|nr:uncharacterized protein UTRI_04452 [Ustilago trichophora]